MNEVTWTTYRMEDGSLINGDYAWVDSPETFQDVIDTTKVIKETWILQKSEIVTFEPFFWDESYYNEED